METLPRAELEVMQVLWAAEPPLTSRVVLDAVSDGRNWKIQTVATLLTRLVNRGFLSSSRSGREIHYQINVPRDEYLEFETADFVSKHRGYPLRGLVSAFADNGALSEADIEELSAWLESQKHR